MKQAGTSIAHRRRTVPLWGVNGCVGQTVFCGTNPLAQIVPRRYAKTSGFNTALECGWRILC